MTDPSRSEQQETRVSSLINRALKSATLINTFWLGSSSLASGVLGAVASALLARSLGVSDFGILTLVITMMNLMIDLADLGLTSTFVRFGSESVALGDTARFQQVLAVILRYKLLLGSIVVSLAVLLMKPIVHLAFAHVDERIASYFLLSLVAASLTIVASIYYPLLQSHKNFRLHSLLTIIRFGSKLLFIIFVIGIAGRMSVPWGIWIEILSVLLFLVLNISYSPVRTYSFTVEDKKLQHEMLSFNKWLLIYQLITLASSRLDIFLVGGFSTSNDLGLYSAASKISGLVIAVTNSYYAVLLSEISAQSSGVRIQSHKRRATIVVWLVVAMIPLLAILAGPITRVVFGSAYTGAGFILQILCIGIAFTVLAYPINAALFAHNRSEVFSLMAVVSAITMIFGNIYMIPRFGSVGAAAVFSFSAFLSCAVAFVYYLLKKGTLQ